MTTKFAIIDPVTREYSLEADRDAAIDRIAQNAVDTYINHYNNGAVCSLVDVQDDGTEKWYTQDGIPTPSPEEIKAKMQKLLQPKMPGPNIPVVVL
jgi:hypothetical protein